MKPAGGEGHPGLVRQLEVSGYPGLFQSLSGDVLAEIWRGGRSRDALEAVATDSGLPDLPRFLAVAVLVHHLPPAEPLPHASELAQLYARALARNLPGSANPWGLPGGPPGALAEQILRLGSEALPALEPLLEDPTPLVWGGSREVMSAERYHYRVKDVAASLIARLRGKPWPPDFDPDSRDRRIEGLQTQGEGEDEETGEAS